MLVSSFSLGFKPKVEGTMEMSDALAERIPIFVMPSTEGFN
jgi:hypothetical protein